MITVINGADRARWLPTLNSMFELRHEVFVKRLGWPLNAANGREIDQFDHDDAHYLVLPNSAGEVIASCRMTMTTRPNLLTDVFPHLIERPPVPRSPDIWEVSRVAVDHRRERLALLPPGVNPAGALFCSMFEFAMLVGARLLVSVSDPYIERILRIAGWALQPLGPVTALATGGSAVAESAAVSNEQLMAIRRRTRTYVPVLDSAAVQQTLQQAA
jgi:N-acyl-L-homoserine lactone synthetase